ncbi:TPM domain-containing protein [Tenacibaculum sp. FZY0031]|uniref:TPM domain-containing protein n=1 Tax=Tenacibaculum sp. FZY0031 TaxID=3116648 RepID=UPI002EA6A6FA|nr:TPM domain-containing protein [Tenacibaculum sp. FZY0031]
MSNVEDFLTAKEEEEIVQAIREAERNTSGEIRVHIEKTTKGSHYDRALEVFQMLTMFNTQQRNGVLLYIAVDDYKFVIYGDEGINNVVPQNFWETTKEAIQNQFKQGNFKQGIIDGVLKAGKELQTHFPWTTDDEDELSNEISKG